MSVITVRPQTVTPDELEAGELIDFVAAMRARGMDVPGAKTQLRSSDGELIDLPDELFEVLKFVAHRLVAHQGVTVVPVDQQLTTQQAAEFLGISRPSLVKIIEAGDLPCVKVGRHRRVKLADLVDYERRQSLEREAALTELAAIADNHDLYASTAVEAEGIR